MDLWLISNPGISGISEVWDPHLETGSEPHVTIAMSLGTVMNNGVYLGILEKAAAVKGVGMVAPNAVR